MLKYNGKSKINYILEDVYIITMKLKYNIVKFVRCWLLQNQVTTKEATRLPKLTRFYHTKKFG